MKLFFYLRLSAESSEVMAQWPHTWLCHPAVRLRSMTSLNPTLQLIKCAHTTRTAATSHLTVCVWHSRIKGIVATFHKLFSFTIPPFCLLSYCTGATKKKTHLLHQNVKETFWPCCPILTRRVKPPAHRQINCTAMSYHLNPSVIVD